jgi:hypothetical protein
MLTPHEKIEQALMQLEDEHDNLRNLMKLYVRSSSKELRKLRLDKWKLIVAESYRKYR